MHNYLFVCGTARSGTTAMWKQLTADTRIALGLERYLKRLKQVGLTPELYEKPRFFDLQPGDTGYPNLLGFDGYYKKLQERYDFATYRGDKLPMLYAHLEDLLTVFPTAKVIITVRNIFDVAYSYEKRADEGNRWPEDRRTSSAIADWRIMLTALNRFFDDPRILPVLYEDFFFNQHAIDPLYRFLGLELNDTVKQAFAETIARSKTLEDSRTRGLSQAQILDISLHAPFWLYRTIVEKIRARNTQSL